MFVQNLAVLLCFLLFFQYVFWLYFPIIAIHTHYLFHYNHRISRLQIRNKNYFVEIQSKLWLRAAVSNYEDLLWKKPSKVHDVLQCKMWTGCNMIPSWEFGILPRLAFLSWNLVRLCHLHWIFYLFVDRDSGFPEVEAVFPTTAWFSCTRSLRRKGSFPGVRFKTREHMKFLSCLHRQP